MKTRALLLLLCLGNAALAGEPKTFASFLELPWKFVIGGQEGGRWLDSETAGRRLTAPKTSYRVFTLKGEAGTVSAARAAPDPDVCPDLWIQELTPEPDLQRKAVGVNASWEPMPRKVTISDTTQEVYVKAVREILAEKGLAKPKVKITQLLRADLDGDGEEEVLMSATNFGDPAEGIAPRAGDYSFVAMRRVIGGKVRTQTIGGDFYPKANDNAAPDTFEVMAVLDLNGDGILEVIIKTSYYEGGGVQVWQLQKDKLMPVLRINCGV